MLKLIKTGVGGRVRTYIGYVTIPAYNPPVVVSGVLSFYSSDDYNLFLDAVRLMEDYWEYSEIDYEDTPQEIYHLGEDPLNALDSTFGFNSLRYQYEVNEFHNYDWKDTAAIYVEDDDMQMVMNGLNEVKIGQKFYKYLTNTIIAEVNNSYVTLDSVRVWGILTPGTNFQLFDEEIGTIVSQTEAVESVQGCADFGLSLRGSLSTYISPTARRWSISTSVLNPVSGSHHSLYDNVKASYTIDWGDGSIETIIGYFGKINWFYHVYQYPTSGFLNRTITVTCQLIQQSSPSTGYTNLINNCASLPAIIFTATTTVRLDSYNYPDCLQGRIVREFEGTERDINGTRYRVECKLKQVTTGAGFIFAWQRPKIVATIVFTKRKGGRWKKTKSLGELKLIVRGDVYREHDCSNLFYAINYPKSKSNVKKIKLKFLGIPETVLYFPSEFRTSKHLPNAINADYIWKYNNNQSTVGNYNEVLKP